MKDIEKITKLKADGKKIVFTNGCFDIIHAGHVSYLKEAASLGDVLVLGLNSDESVRRLKGPGRPVNNEQDRKIVLGAIRYVDFVVIFEEDTPLNLIKQIVPDVLVKGGDWAIEHIVGREVVQENGGTVMNIKFVDGKSTTSIIEKIRKK